MKKISVIVPIYNVEKYLERCIESIINQTYKNLEIILIDDGSPDKCGTICDKYSKMDSRIVVIHKENGGLSDARNAGIKVATGDYISYIDSDDYIDTDMYEYMINELEFQNSDIVICGIYKEFEDGKSYIKTNRSIERLENKEALIRLNSFASFDMAVWNKLYKKSVIEGIEFPIGKKSEDYFVMYQYFNKSQMISILPDPKYHYLQRENSISRGKNISHDYIEGSLKQRDFFKENYPEIEFVGNTAYAFSYIATYNRYLKYNIYISKENSQKFKAEVRKYIKDVITNPYISRIKKVQAIVFGYSLFVYKVLMKVIRG